MTKEIVELPDRKSGDINEIRDKKIALAKDATAQSDLPQQLEYLIKNGQTGEFMNVLDSYINEKIRSALGGLIASLDKGAAGTTKAIACIDTNNDLGIINPANLASVLGESLHIETASYTDGTSYGMPTNYGTFLGIYRLVTPDPTWGHVLSGELWISSNGNTGQSEGLYYRAYINKSVGSWIKVA